MKKLLSFILIFIVVTVAVPFAASIEIPASLVYYEYAPWDDGDPDDINDLDHDYAYIWKINLDGVLDVNEVITGATIEFDNITNWEAAKNILQVSLLDITTPPSMAPQDDHIFAIEDNQDPSNYFEGIVDIHYTQSDYIDYYIDDNDIPAEYWYQKDILIREDYTMVLSQDNLDNMNLWKADNNWIGIGLDPDCHYWNDGVKLVLTTSEVPEPSTIGVLGLSLLSFSGISFFRRRRK